jgi:hypothetical protein
MSQDDVLTLARERFKRCVDHESENRKKQRDDIRFAHASPDDPWQWDPRAKKARDDAGRPSLTINKLPQHVKQVTNDIRQNRPSIKYRAANDKAAPETAEILTGIARHIEANSDADVAYDTAADHEVTHGLGYIRALTDYVGDDSFDQDIFIRRVRDPFKVYMDPDAEDPAGSDAQFAFIEETLTEDEFKSQYPKADAVNWDFETYGDWFSQDKKVRVAEYYSLERKEDELSLWQNGETSFKSDGKLPPGVIPGERPLKTRTVKRTYLVWRKITGNQELEKREYQWKYIPIARVIGNEALIDGKLVLSGIVRNAKDAQRMYNVAQSAITERVMLAPKAPWAAPAAAIEGHEAYWDTANTANHSYLPWNHLDDQGQPVPPPQRTAPATVEPGLQQIMLVASDDIKATTGQFDASLGERSNETSGKAIMARQREGDTATYHYVDNLARAVRHIGRIILDMMPTVYDTQRVARILGEDMSEGFAHVNPNMDQAYAEMETPNGVEKVFNPNVGRYDVVVTTGPSFTTRRMEAFEAMQQMTQANPQLWGVIGDQLVRNMDWPGAEDMAERLKVTLIPPVRELVENEGKPQEIPPQAQMMIDGMQQQMQQMQEQMQQADVTKHQNEQVKLQIEAHKAEIEDKRADIDQYDAETRRIAALNPPAVGMTPEQVQMLVMQVMQQNGLPAHMGEPQQPAMPEQPQGF